jgi:hypothetical protein
LGDREKPDALEIGRYIVAEPGTIYTIEITLKEGFKFDPYDHVTAELWIPGEKDAPLSFKVIHDPTPNKYRTREDLYDSLRTVTNKGTSRNFSAVRSVFVVLQSVR